MGWFSSKPDKYINKFTFTYHSPRYNEDVTVPKGMPSDGATGFLVKDLNRKAFLVHDRICDYGKWDSGKPITNWQASNVYADILKKTGMWQWWDRKWATFFFGGKKLKWF